MNTNENSSNKVGAPPHKKPWPEDPKYDPDLLKNGDYRNVIDKYRYWYLDEIKKDLAKNSLPIQIAVENFQYDFNIGTIVRNANAFNVLAVHIIGRKHWNKRGAMVTDRYLQVYYHKTVDEFNKAVQGWNIIAVDNIKGATKLQEFIFPKNPVLVFGAEGPGLSQEMLNIASSTIAIEQYGSTRSLNVGVASGIILYEAVQPLNHSHEG